MLQLFKQAKLGKRNLTVLLIFITLQVLGTLYLPTLTADIINYGVMQGNRDYVFRTGGFMLIVAVLTGIFSILGTYFSAEVSTRFAKNTRKQLFDRTQELSYQDYKHFHASSLITRATNDVEQVQTTLGMFFEMMLPAPFVLVVGTILALRRDFYMALIIITSATLFALIIGIIARFVLPIFAKVQKGLDEINSTVGQYISGIRVVRAFNRTKLETKRMNNSFNHFAKLNISINRTFALMLPLVMLVMSLVAVAITWFGGVRINSGNMQIGDITAVIEYAMNILMYVIMAVFTLIYIPRAKVCAARIREVLDYCPEIVDAKNAEYTESAKIAKIIKTNNVSEKSDSKATNKTTLRFKNVCFGYHEAENQVLHDISFDCIAGTTTAIIGGTGSGKTTLARLIPRLLDTTSGEILLDGVNVKDLPQESVRKRIGFVLQKAFLFSGTVADNLCHGNANADEKEMERILQIAQSKEFVDEKGGLEAVIEQGGKNLSGGQRQRLSIARMLMKKPDIYVFDDSFSALDFKTDAALRQALKPETTDAIVINIAQRISTIRDAEQIIVLDEGKIAGKGTHDELMKTCEVYKEIAYSQLSEDELSQKGL
ncbi:MAG: ABC transporter ATP-binding protein/permease [Oscillospiraceae bacterium]|nr:ABC transporter ATP-binding protein/permease [Oscillospiraceae bacterium]